MLTINVRNVNQALPIAVKVLRTDGVEVVSRGMRTLEYPEPVCTTYTHPRERVLFSPERDANPFFHFMEALWIIGGRQDVEWLSQFNSRIADYSDNGINFHAPYGYRLRHNFRIDQIEAVIDMLKVDPDTRQAVLSIWDPELDLNKRSRDIPCNDTVFFKIRDGKLNMTVCCRSNDVLWGAYGANVVQFSTLQEYIACMVGIEVGVYNQISDSFHIYLDGPGGECWKRVANLVGYTPLYENLPLPMMNDGVMWNKDLSVFFENPLHEEFNELYFYSVAKPMFAAWEQYKSGNLPGALNIIEEVAAEDWREVCVEWLKRRIK